MMDLLLLLFELSRCGPVNSYLTSICARSAAEDLEPSNIAASAFYDTPATSGVEFEVYAIGITIDI